MLLGREVLSSILTRPPAPDFQTHDLARVLWARSPLGPGILRVRAFAHRTSHISCGFSRSRDGPGIFLTGRRGGRWCGTGKANLQRNILISLRMEGPCAAVRCSVRPRAMETQRSRGLVVHRTGMSGCSLPTASRSQAGILGDLDGPGTAGYFCSYAVLRQGPDTQSWDVFRRPCPPETFTCRDIEVAHSQPTEVAPPRQGTPGVCPRQRDAVHLVRPIEFGALSIFRSEGIGLLVRVRRVAASGLALRSPLLFDYLKQRPPPPPAKCW